MKRMLAIAVAFVLLAGCAAAESELPAAGAGAPKAPMPEPDPVGETETVQYELNYVNMALELPEGWGYAYAGTSVDDGEVHAGSAAPVGIRFWPDAAEDTGGGALALYYYADLFGVCGTGLSTEEIVLDSGLTGTVGTYDGGPMWSFISFHNTPGSYVVLNEGADGWWDEYSGQAMAILYSIRVGEGICSQSEAEELAKGVCTVEYDRIRSAFDGDGGEWEIYFYKSSAAGGGQTVWIAPNGEIVTDYLVGLDRLE